MCFKRHLYERRLCKTIRSNGFGPAAFTEKCTGLIRRGYSVPANPSPSLRLVPGKFMPSRKTFSVLVVLGIICAQTATAQPRFGAQGAEAEPGRHAAMAGAIA